MHFLLIGDQQGVVELHRRVERGESWAVLAPVDEDGDDSDYASEYESDSNPSPPFSSETDGSENLQTYCRENPTTRRWACWNSRPGQF